MARRKKLETVASTSLPSAACTACYTLTHRPREPLPPSVATCTERAVAKIPTLPRPANVPTRIR